MENMTILEFIGRVNKSETRKRLIPMELSSGWPVISIKSKQICITLPYFRAKPIGGGKVALFPLSYLLTVTWPNAMVVEFASLKYKKEYKGIDFGKQAGIFKHEAVMSFSKDEYMSKRNELFSHYEKLIECITEQKDFVQEDEMRRIFQIMMEPSLYPMYKNVSSNFFECYCGL